MVGVERSDRCCVGVVGGGCWEECVGCCVGVLRGL